VFRFPQHYNHSPQICLVFFYYIISDILDGGNLSNDDDLDKEPTLDESTFKITSKNSDDIDQELEISPFKMPKAIKKFGEDIVDLKGSSDEEQDETSFKKPKKSEESNKATSNKKSAAPTLVGFNKT